MRDKLALPRAVFKSNKNRANHTFSQFMRSFCFVLATFESSWVDWTDHSHECVVYSVRDRLGVKSRTVRMKMPSLHYSCSLATLIVVSVQGMKNRIAHHEWRKNTPNRRKKAISCPKKARKRALLSIVYKGGQSVCLADGMDVIPRSSPGQTTK